MRVDANEYRVIDNYLIDVGKGYSFTLDAEIEQEDYDRIVPKEILEYTDDIVDEVFDLACKESIEQYFGIFKGNHYKDGNYEFLRVSVCGSFVTFKILEPLYTHIKIRDLETILSRVLYHMNLKGEKNHDTDGLSD